MTLPTIKRRLKQQLGSISDNDQYHYELLIDAWTTYLRAQDDLRLHGIVVRTGDRPFVNPAVNVSNEAHKQIIKLSKLFGIEPISRSELKADDDELGAIIDDA